ncbi:hypothetical protein C5167_036105 [Papaver somniferum]|nr:hypothetical protein C5167_036105 [Papaver somniferum]
MFVWMQRYFTCRCHPNGISLVQSPDESLHMLQPVRHADSLVSLKAVGQRTSKQLRKTKKLQYTVKTKPSASQDTQYDSLVLNFLRKCTSQKAPARYSSQDLKYAAENLHFLYQTLSKCETVVSQYLEDHPEASAARRAVQENFQDLDTPELLSAALHRKLSLITKDLDKISKGQYPQWKLLHLADMQKEVENLLRSQGLLPFSDYSEVLKQLQFFDKRRVG